jgi:anti-sigma-K factor RskA
MLPGLALGSLEPQEARRARAHLAVCEACRQELASMDDLVGRMAMALPAAEPPAGLEERVMERIKGAGRRARSPVAFFRHPAVAAIAAALVLFLGAGNVVQWLRVSSLARTPVAPGFITIVLKAAEPGLKVTGTMVLDSHSHGGTLAVRGLRRLDTEHQYQLWLVRRDERRSGGVFNADEYGYANLLLLVPADFRDFTAIGVSIEPAGGSPAPTGARVATGKL